MEKNKESLMPVDVNRSDSLSSNESPISLNKSWTQRTFGRIEPGSIRGSIFALVSVAMGPGYLTTPFILHSNGIILGLLIITGSGYLIYISLYTVAKCAYKYKIYHYPSVTQKMLGNKWSFILELTFILNSYALIIAFNIIIGNLVPMILSSFSVREKRIIEKWSAMIVLNVVIIIPLSLMRNLGAIKYKSVFKMIILTFVLLVVIIEVPFFAKQNNYTEIKYFSVNLSIFNSFSLSLFAHLCHQNLTRVQGELVRPTLERIEKVAKRSMIVLCIYFGILSVCGYISCLNSTPELIILRKPPKSISNDAAMVACRGMMVIVANFAIPLNLNLCRESLQKMIFKVDDEASTSVHFGITLGILVSALCAAMFLPNVIAIFDFIGGFCGSMMVFIVPSLLYVKLNGQPLTYWKNIAVLTIAWGLGFAGFASVFIAIYKEVKPSIF